eukprot:349681-Chlamydomonas_euryale.AAC.6
MGGRGGRNGRMVAAPTPSLSCTPTAIEPSTRLRACVARSDAPPAATTDLPSTTRLHAWIPVVTASTSAATAGASPLAASRC